MCCQNLREEDNPPPPLFLTPILIKQLGSMDKEFEWLRNCDLLCFILFWNSWNLNYFWKLKLFVELTAEHSFWTISLPFILLNVFHSSWSNLCLFLRGFFFVCFVCFFFPESILLINNEKKREFSFITLCSWMYILEMFSILILDTFSAFFVFMSSVNYKHFL